MRPAHLAGNLALDLCIEPISTQSLDQFFAGRATRTHPLGQPLSDLGRFLFRNLVRRGKDRIVIAVKRQQAIIPIQNKPPLRRNLLLIDRVRSPRPVPNPCAR